MFASCFSWYQTDLCCSACQYSLTNFWAASYFQQVSPKYLQDCRKSRFKDSYNRNADYYESEKQEFTYASTMWSSHFFFLTFLSQVGNWKQMSFKTCHMNFLYKLLFYLLRLLSNYIISSFHFIPPKSPMYPYLLSYKFLASFFHYLFFIHICKCTYINF